MIPTVISNLYAEEEAPPSPVPSAAGRSPNDGGSVAEEILTEESATEGSVPGAFNHQQHEYQRNSLSSIADTDDEERAANRKSAGVSLTSVEDVAEKRSPGSDGGFVKDEAQMSPSTSESGDIGDTAAQGDTEIPVGYESTSMYLETNVTRCPNVLISSSYQAVPEILSKEETAATPFATPIPPVTDRISSLPNPVPYYATPKIMVHSPSQSFGADDQISPTIDEVSTNERQSLSEARSSQPPHSTLDGNRIDAPPIQSMSLRPIAWQASKAQKVGKRKLYLRKIRNAAARKTILKATLGRQLAIPTKQMLRLLADGENLTVPDLSNNSVEAATMLVPQEAVGSVTGAVLLPQGVAGAASDD